MFMREKILIILFFTGICSSFVNAQAFNDYSEPPHNYWEGELNDPMSLLLKKVESGETKFDKVLGLPLVEDLLKALKISKDSQILVFSKTSLQRAAVSASNPRAIYFNEDVYLGWMPDGRIEIASADPEKGFMFFFQRPLKDKRSPLFIRDKVCLECHAGSATNFLPGPLGRSVFPDIRGRSLGSVDSYELIGHNVPISERWGGWYVTGAHPSLKHMGNSIAYRSSNKKELKLKVMKSKLDSDRIFESSKYPNSDSDIVALLIFDHQVGIHYELVEAAYKARQAIYNSEKLGGSNEAELEEAISSITDNLVSHLLMKDETKLSGEVLSLSRDSTFIGNFKNTSKNDSEGRSLRDLDLKNRIFKYPCSYMIYSKSFTALPEILRNSIFKQIRGVLSNKIKVGEYDYISDEKKLELLEILGETIPFFSIRS